ncbi:pentatricopeptide repeat-containing protein At1g11290, chloroplastic-like [Selaginella moellendorffii]|uniref:pentatricopeptide repeat-containing protein At1g11290, chloroplastic-like n=1 Tax=Selaginella moellendorffii TaxID=88036 RepID=UPI000D1C7349|nr:pentatricopeptide repeat-containing protein At1g11290, chloroplastic-like [Selaginella moellendorffii]|eukprot:XP_024536179.1 pentatricopeptide repeat-containing protein At1g11290, chloroplastic-like [Selaginella moellendorffii]
MAIDQRWATLGPFRERLERVSNLSIQQASSTYASLLRNCTDMAQGKEIHTKLIDSRFDTDTFLGNLLVQMYGNFSSPMDAQAAFDRIQQPNVFSWTLLLTAYAHNGDLDTARDVFERMPSQDLVSRTTMLVSYTKNQKFSEAKEFFDKMPEKNVVAWNSLLTAYAKKWHSAEAMILFELMNLEGVKPSSLTFTGIFGACGVLPAAFTNMVVEIAIESGYLTNPFVASAVIHLLGRQAGSLFKARQLFDNISSPTAAAWNAMVAAYAWNGLFTEAYRAFCLMDLEGVQADDISFLNVLASCESLSIALVVQSEIQASATKTSRSRVLGTALITSYAKFGDLEAAIAVFYDIHELERDVVAYTALVGAYSMHGFSEKAIQLFCFMDLQGMKADEVVYVSLFDACSKDPGYLRQGRILHEFLVESGVPLDVILATSILSMYGKCGSVADAWKVFETVSSSSNPVTWNSMISTLSRGGHCDEALQLFREMSLEGVAGTLSTLVSVLEACTRVEDLPQVQLLHAIAKGLGMEAHLAASLVTAYGFRGDLHQAKSVFERTKALDVVLWTAMVAVYTKSGLPCSAAKTFQEMELEGVKADEVSLMAAIEALDLRFVHARVVEMGLESLWSGIIDLYGKAGELERAREVFWSVSESQRKAVTYNALIGAYVQSGDCEGALRVSRLMDQTGVKLNDISYLAMIDACAGMGNLPQAKSLHSRILGDATIASKNTRNKLGNALISMYGRCGDSSAAVLVFRDPWMEHHRDIVSWNSILACYAQNGRSEESVEMFWEMRLDGSCQPDAITFSTLLSACSRAGFVDHAHHCWLWLREIDPLGVATGVEHYVCMVDVLARSGQVGKAEDLIHSMPYEPDDLCGPCERAWPLAITPIAFFDRPNCRALSFTSEVVLKVYFYFPHFPSLAELRGIDCEEGDSDGALEQRRGEARFPGRDAAFSPRRALLEAGIAGFRPWRIPEWSPGRDCRDSLAPGRGRACDAPGEGISCWHCTK